MGDRRDSEHSTEMAQIPSKKVAFHSPDPSHSPLLNGSEPERNRFVHSSRRHRTDMNDVRIESRAFRHDQMFRRPRALHYKSLDDVDATSPATSRSRDSTVSSRRSSNSSEEETTERSTDNLPKQRNRLDLFVDLIWVGIIANLSENFGSQAYENSDVGLAIATGEFILLFIVIWRVWDNLRVYTTAFFIDDILQRKFSIWILLLAVLYGINAPFAYSGSGEGDSLTLLIVTYIITKVSFTAAFGINTIFLPFLRRLFYFQLVTTSLIIGIWIGAIFAPYPAKLGLLIAANAVEQPIGTFLASPTADRLFTKEMKRHPDHDHCVERYEGFFIVILGEGVFRLISGSPSGLGMNSNTGTVLAALLLYYILHWIYFNGDQSKEFIHALRRTWWKPVLWQVLHVMMFGALLFLDASVLFLVKNRGASLAGSGSSGDSGVEARQEGTSTEESAEDIGRYANYALWVASIALGETILCMSGIALLNRNVDGPGTLVVNSRLLRIAPRLPATAFIVCLPLIPGMNGAIWCGAATSVLYGVFMWEWIAGLEKDWKVFEPKEK